MYSTFFASHRGGSGPPLVCLHGFTDTWRVWELVLPMLERHHDVLAPTLPGHVGRPRLDGAVSARTLGDAVERAMDGAGFEAARIVGNSLGGHVALRVAARGRADSVVAFALAAAGPRAIRCSQRCSPTRQSSTVTPGRPRPMPRRSSPGRPAGVWRARFSRPTSSTFPPTCSSTSCSASPAVAARGG